MEDVVNVKTNEVKSQEPSESVDTADSTTKLLSNELSPDSTSELENPINKIEQLNSFVTSNNKVNGDCVVDCSGPPSYPPNNSSLDPGQISPGRSGSFIEKSYFDNGEGNLKFGGSKKKDIDIVPLARDQSNNLDHIPLPDQPEDRPITSENKCLNISNVNEVSSTLEEKTVCEDTTVKSENRPISLKTRKSSSDSSSSGLNKNNETFKQPTSRYELKSSTSKTNKSGENATSEGVSKQNEVSNKPAEKTNRNNKRKSEDRDKFGNSFEGDPPGDAEKFPIQYKGFKKKNNDGIEKRINLRWNPFNPACKANQKSNKCIPSRLPVGDDVDCGSLQQSEYAQYLGLQPILKFRCSNCGSSGFQSMVALNTHQMECTKTGKGKLDKSPPTSSNSIIEPKSTNIKLTRKVFLCSACGTYYEHWNLFLHMREVHRRYICLYCLGMFSIAEKLSEHLTLKHKVINQNFCNLDEFQKHSYQTFFLLCLICDKVFSEMDDFYGHVCTANKKNIDNTEVMSNKLESVSSQDGSIAATTESCTIVANKTGTKRTRENNRKNALSVKSSQVKKEDTPCGNYNQKMEDSAVTSDVKPEDTNKIRDVGCIKVVEQVNETPATESVTCTQNENEMKSCAEQEVRQQESLQVSVPSVPPPVDKGRPSRKSKFVPKKAPVKRKKLKEKEEETEASSSKLKKIVEDEPLKEVPPTTTPLEEVLPLAPPPETDDVQKHATSMDTSMEKEVINDSEDSAVPNTIQDDEAELDQECDKEKPESGEQIAEKETDIGTSESSSIALPEAPELPKGETPAASLNGINPIETKTILQTNLLKFKLSGIQSDGESDDSQKLSLVVDETPASDTEQKVSSKSGNNSRINSPELPEEENLEGNRKEEDSAPAEVSASCDVHGHDITLASGDVAVMALTLDDKIENIPIQTVLKECVRTSCMSCNYCRHAVKIAVNGKQLALHILSEHRYMPIKNETPDDVINKLKTCLGSLQTVFFNAETYDNSDTTIHVPYDQDSSFDCFQCNYVTSSHRDLFAHKRKSHTKTLLLCIMCKSNFYSYSELLCHLCPGMYNAEVEFHNVDINFRCCFCRLDTIPSAFRLMVHLRKTHHTCDICLENGVDQQKLSTHMWKHKLNHLCYRCGIAYASKPDITKHLFWKHGHESVLCKKCLQKKWPHVYHFCIPPTSFICEECNTSFSKAVALKVHKRIHGNDFPYTCTECNKKYVSKKLLKRHEERHLAIKNNVGQVKGTSHEEDQKDEMINVTDVINETKESSLVDVSDSKDVEPKDKSHKKHKKDKEKKDKKVVDVYDLPPLNLSSESDSSDEDAHVNDRVDKVVNPEDKNEKTTTPAESKELEDNKIRLGQADEGAPNHADGEKVDEKVSSPKVSVGNNDGETTSAVSVKGEAEHPDKELFNINSNNVEDGTQKDSIDNLNIKESENEQEGENVSSSDATATKDVENIWKNFYKTNSQNSNLPYPLCAIQSDVAVGIIMGDHDYCLQSVEPPLFGDNIPSTSGISEPLLSEQLEEVSGPQQEKVSDVPEVSSTSTPVSSPKKKPKSPKKKNVKAENDNSSSSSDSSSESSDTSCSCGPNCSCSSSSSNSSSSSSSDSESSAGEEGQKQERKKKKRDRHSKTKSDVEPQLPKEAAHQPEIEPALPLEPVDPPIRESELETDETTTDEEFYDQQPQRIANQLLAEKRNQLMLLASAANANNGSASPSPIVDVVQPELTSVPVAPKQKVRTKRKRKVTTKGKNNNEKNTANSHTFSHFPKDTEPVIKQNIQYPTNSLPITEPKLTPLPAQVNILTETPGSGSETEKSRSSKRRRIPNKFYGYSSGEEDDKPTPSPKWRKQDTPSQPSRIQPAHPPTPRIQLTVPKQIIRKPFKLQQQKPVPKEQQSSSDSTDSGSEVENPKAQQHHQVVPPVTPDTSTSTTTTTPAAATTSQKNDKDVYCYCRCPYDEVSEMIACDDENCEIEWFHFECVGILIPPRGQWYCPGCRKARGLPT